MEKHNHFLILILIFSLVIMTACSPADVSGDKTVEQPFKTIELDYDFPKYEFVTSSEDGSMTFKDYFPDSKYIKINGELKTTEGGYYEKSYSFDVTPDADGRITIVMPWTCEKDESLWRVNSNDVNVLFLSHYSLIPYGEMLDGGDRSIGMCVLEPTDETESIELQYIFIRDPQGEKTEEVMTTVTLNLK